jgi:hypothetical protein
MITVVRLSKSLRRADITMCSVVESSDDVATGSISDDVNNSTIKLKLLRDDYCALLETFAK